MLTQNKIKENCIKQKYEATQNRTYEWVKNQTASERISCTNEMTEVYQGGNKSKIEISFRRNQVTKN